MTHMTLILGGARSGKSRFAQDLAQKTSGDEVVFIATAEARDAEMSRRIHLHRNSRPAAWSTLEAVQNVGAFLQRHQQSRAKHQTVLVDCLTMLVSNVLLKCGEDAAASITEQCVYTEIQGLLAACKQWRGSVIIVSGEVGLGVVPESPLGRQYRDLLGWANQAVAARSNETYLMVAGIPIEIKSISENVGRAAAKMEISK